MSLASLGNLLIVSIVEAAMLLGARMRELTVTVLPPLPDSVTVCVRTTFDVTVLSLPARVIVLERRRDIRQHMLKSDYFLTLCLTLCE